jgi:hypothetical protein
MKITAYNIGVFLAIGALSAGILHAVSAIAGTVSSTASV